MPDPFAVIPAPAISGYVEISGKKGQKNKDGSEALLELGQSSSRGSNPTPGATGLSWEASMGSIPAGH